MSSSVGPNRVWPRRDPAGRLSGKETESFLILWLQTGLKDLFSFFLKNETSFHIIKVLYFHCIINKQKTLENRDGDKYNNHL